MTNQEENTICSIIECDAPAGERPTVISTYRLPISLHLCNEHTYDLAINQKKRIGEFAARLEEEGTFERAGHSKGWTYVIRVSSGYIKIGYTTQKGLVRLQKLSGDQGGVPVQVLAVTQGGESREALAHKQWGHLRASGKQELFHPDPSLLAWAAEQGIDPASDIDDFHGWAERKHQDPKRNGAEKYAVTEDNKYNDNDWTF
ncbi:hypothetical protein AB0C48_00430 [Streptomyces sp. NPDC048556]|uniref:hypothetical protein n=1 Tax=Streptomyces sp. NPDC048556 TaxID=3156664 RepID=UPI00344684A0